MEINGGTLTNPWFLSNALSQAARLFGYGATDGDSNQLKSFYEVRPFFNFDASAYFGAPVYDIVERIENNTKIIKGPKDWSNVQVQPFLPPPLPPASQTAYAGITAGIDSLNAGSGATDTEPAGTTPTGVDYFAISPRSNINDFGLSPASDMFLARALWQWALSEGFPVPRSGPTADDISTWYRMAATDSLVKARIAGILASYITDITAKSYKGTEPLTSDEQGLINDFNAYVNHRQQTTFNDGRAAFDAMTGQQSQAFETFVQSHPEEQPPPGSMASLVNWNPPNELTGQANGELTRAQIMGIAGVGGGVVGGVVGNLVGRAFSTQIATVLFPNMLRETAVDAVRIGVQAAARAVPVAMGVAGAAAGVVLSVVMAAVGPEIDMAFKSKAAYDMKTAIEADPITATSLLETNVYVSRDDPERDSKLAGLTDEQKKNVYDQYDLTEADRRATGGVTPEGFAMLLNATTNMLTASTVRSAPAGSGGSASLHSLTNADGSKSTVLGQPNGTVIVRTQFQNGSTSLFTQNPDGTSVTTIHRSDGSVTQSMSKIKNGTVEITTVTRLKAGTPEEKVLPVATAYGPLGTMTGIGSSDTPNFNNH